MYGPHPASRPLHSGPPAVEAFLLGEVDFDACLALQQRLVYESTGRNDGQIQLLLCEHPAVITVGRLGSRGHIGIADEELARREIAIRWVNRGGGCLLHAPGQLAIYPIVPLQWHRFSVGDYLLRLQSGIRAALDELNLPWIGERPRGGLWGRAGQLVALGAAVKNWTTYHGAFVNVSPTPQFARDLKTDPLQRTPMSSLVVERRQPVRMTSVRTALVRHLAASFGCERYHVHTGHPLLERPRPEAD